ncbi:tyrosine--tRNA ligase [Candidatus Gottesmanbacteria bacterium RBG_16_37_8]|uniref:Tyrosine--tRNA ligase n=1 Tax=Candidatus Gottesmanbacteria bacterium RBG_16_37_8 TaxID=1798371 RepID=A0A1F5YTA2_9BACT|nr:MAG: tyrosine--tRNA ligase [Candidatus Gottesmanbacteria bacterium RBG_16_37_8]
MDKIDEILNRGVANIIPSHEALEKELKSGKKLNIYLGIDPTFVKLHLGNAVPLRKIEQFANAGHNVTFLIGDYTALIGDTSDKDSERPSLTKEQIGENFKTYKKQAEKVLDFSKVKVRYNSEWLGKLTYEEMIKLTKNFSLGDFLSRELIKKRLNEGKYINLSEVLYPVAQGYDSFSMDTDVQVGGTDQTFNMQAGRTLIKNWKSKESFVLATPMLEGTDGRKMSKSYGNAIWLDDNAFDMYTKVMAINDDLIVQYYLLATAVPMDKVSQIEKELKKGTNPMQIKKDLAFEIVKELYNEEDARRAKENFEKTVQKGETPTEIPEIKFKKNQKIEDLLVEKDIVTSKSEIKRLGEQGGLALDGKRIKSDEVAKEGILKIGKTRHYRLISA